MYIYIYIYIHIATCLDAWNVPGLPGTFPREIEVIWIRANEMLVTLNDKTRAADESMRTYVKHGKSDDWLAVVSSASSRPATKTGSDIADDEIALWRMRLDQLQAHNNPLIELKCTS